MTETLQHQQPEAASAEESKVQTAAASPNGKPPKSRLPKRAPEKNW